MNRHKIAVSQFAKECEGSTRRVTMANEMKTDPQYIVIEFDSHARNIYLELDDQIHSSTNAVERIEVNPSRMLVKIRRESSQIFYGCSDIEVVAAGDQAFPADVLSELGAIATAANGLNL